VFVRRHGERARHGGALDGREGGVGVEHVSELGDALSSVGATASREATEKVAGQTARSTHAQALDARGS
jgi:hypothetical protein